MKKKFKYIIPLLLLVLSSCSRGEPPTSNPISSESLSTNEIITTSSEDSSISPTSSVSSDKASSTTSKETSSSLSSSISSFKDSSINQETGVVQSGYYKGVDTDSTGATLMNKLHSIIKITSAPSYDSLKEHFKKTDNKDGYFWDMYSNEKYPLSETIAKGNSYEGAGWNREHSIPKSWFGEKSPMYSDIYHLYPTDCYVNNRRSNYPFGEVASASYTSKNGSKLGSSVGNGPSTVFEPIDEYKGDFARTYFYFATCYMDKTINLKNGADVFTGSSSYPKLTTYSINLFLKWDKLDPVSQKEIDRNNVCYGIQKNRNPFIDYPNFAQQIWG